MAPSRRTRCLRWCCHCAMSGSCTTHRSSSVSSEQPCRLPHSQHALLLRARWRRDSTNFISCGESARRQELPHPNRTSEAKGQVHIYYDVKLHARGERWRFNSRSRMGSTRRSKGRTGKDTQRSQARCRGRWTEWGRERGSILIGEAGYR